MRVLAEFDGNLSDVVFDAIGRAGSTEQSLSYVAPVGGLVLD